MTQSSPDQPAQSPEFNKSPGGPWPGAERLTLELKEYLWAAVEWYGGRTDALNPSHRVKFHWPPHPPSYEYHVLATDWTGRSEMEFESQRLEVELARTPFGIFARVPKLWLEIRVEDEAHVDLTLHKTAEPLRLRRRAIAETLGYSLPFNTDFKSLKPLELLKLLYCEDRDVANDAHEAIEVSKQRREYFLPLCAILSDRIHPYRRSAQWCVLDLFEDLPAFIRTEDDELTAVELIRGLLWDAEDDYARTVYKAGVVLGGHIPHRHGGEALLSCLSAPGIVGRRSAIHGLFHVAEWVPALEHRVIHALRDHALVETDPQLGIFAFAIASDIANKVSDHTPEPIFAFER